MNFLRSTTGSILAGLYLLIGCYLFYDAWNCRMMLCDILLFLWTLPTSLLTEFLFSALGATSPRIAYLEGLGNIPDVVGISIELLGNALLVYLLGWAIGRGVSYLRGAKRKPTKNSVA
ncbi:MAG: hypothetical protein U0350_36020 [Caldilineaceae bacterium]